jgi:hypothetical protein
VRPNTIKLVTIAAVIAVTVAVFGTTNSDGAGADNTKKGKSALVGNYGSFNTAVGAYALGAGEHPNSGNDNTAFGYNALARLWAGSNNIALGANAGLNFEIANNNIEIGNIGEFNDDGEIRIGVQGTQVGTHIAGIYGAGVNSGFINVVVDSTGHLGVGLSSERYKEGIEDIGNRSAGLMKLRPVRFHYKNDSSGLELYGLIAEEVAKVYPDLVAYDEKGQPLTVRYHLVNALMLNELQKQSRRIAAQEQKIRGQAERIETLNAQIQKTTLQTQRLEALTARLAQVEALVGAQERGRITPARNAGCDF